MELHRWLRYALPGALFELTFGVWLYFDRLACDCYPDFSKFDTATVAAIAAATLPIGFIMSVLMNEITWCRATEDVFGHLDDLAILEHSGSPLCQTGLDKKEARAYLDVELHLAATGGRETAVQRGRQLIDLMNGLAIGCTAIVVSVLSIAGTLVVTCVRSESWSDGSGWWRAAVLAGALVLWLLLAFLFRCSQRRVARMTDHYLRALLASVAQPPAAEAQIGGQPHED